MWICAGELLDLKDLMPMMMMMMMTSGAGQQPGQCYFIFLLYA